MSAGPLIPPELLSAPRNRWDLTVEGLLVALLVVMPLAFGAVEAASELIVVALAATLSLVVSVRLLVDRTFNVPWTWAFAPLAAFIALAALQLAPLPRSWAAWLSPAAVDLRSELLGADDPAAAAARLPLTMYAPATARGLRLVLVGSVVFLAVVATFRTAPQIKRLLLTVFAIGCAQAALALLQIITRAEKLYWLVDPGTSRLTSGSFVNYSNFSQFMNLSIGAGVALLLVRLHEDAASAQGRHDPSRPFGGASIWQQGALLGGLVLCVVAVLTSLSRNGVVSMLAAAAVVAAALALRGTLSRRGWVLAMLPAAALAVLLLCGFDTVYARLATLGEAGDSLADRWEVTRGALRAWQAFPLFGAGLGTHEYVFPMFDESRSRYLAAHADNDYAQLLEEMGLLGAACAAALLTIIAVKLWQMCRRGQTPLATAAFGLAYGLLAVALHSASDFGQRIPAVFCLSAVTCGLIVQLHLLTGLGTPAAVRRIRPQRPVRRRALAAAALIAVFAAWGWALRGAYAAHLGEAWWAAAYQIDASLQKAGSNAADSEYADLLAATEQAAQAEPSNAVYAYWLNVFRWRAIGRDVDADSGRPWISDEIRPLVSRIADELTAVRRLCPTYGPPYGLEGQLRLFLLDEPAGQDLIRLGVRLAPYDPSTCLAAAEAAAREGRADEAIARLRRTIDIDPTYFGDVARVALEALGRPDIARELAGNDAPRLGLLAEIVAALPGRAALADELRAAAEAAKRRRIADGVAAPSELAAAAAVDAARGDNPSAIELYRRALRADFGQTDWRLGLARALAAAGRDDEAIAEAQRILRLHPRHAQALALILELQSRSARALRESAMRSP